MSNVAAALKAEIIRLSRKAIREHLAPLASTSKAQKKELASLRAKMAALERELKQFRRMSRSGPQPVENQLASTKSRFTPNGLRSLRARLDLSAEDFGLLIGASGQSVYKWESKKATPRQAQIDKIAAIRSLGKREAMARLAAAGKA